jgi:hypothetical protein
MITTGYNILPFVGKFLCHCDDHKYKGDRYAALYLASIISRIYTEAKDDSLRDYLEIMLSTEKESSHDSPR